MDEDESAEEKLKEVLSLRSDRKALLKAVTCFAKQSGDCRSRARDMLAESIQAAAAIDIASTSVADRFLPGIVACRMMHGKSISKYSSFVRARAAIMIFPETVRKRPELVETESIFEVILRHLYELDPDMLVTAAVSSKELMKRVLSKVVDEFLKGDMIGCEIFERLAISEKPEGARQVADLLCKRHGIKCLLW
jgi:hypothetical protein